MQNASKAFVVQRRQGTVRFKSKAGGEQTREALLETKTHRRVNRRQVRILFQALTVPALAVRFNNSRLASEVALYILRIVQALTLPTA